MKMLHNIEKLPGKSHWTGYANGVWIIRKSDSGFRAVRQDGRGWPLFASTLTLMSVALTEAEKKRGGVPQQNPARGPRGSVDGPMAYEIAQYAINDSDLYRQQTTPIILNLQRKIKRGIYDAALALKLWKYLADNAAKKYASYYKMEGTINVPTRMKAAEHLAEHYNDHVHEAQPAKLPRRLSRQIDASLDEEFPMKKNPHKRSSKKPLSAKQAAARRLFVQRVKSGAFKRGRKLRKNPRPLPYTTVMREIGKRGKYSRRKLRTALKRASPARGQKRRELMRAASRIKPLRKNPRSRVQYVMALSRDWAGGKTWYVHKNGKQLTTVGTDARRYASEKEALAWANERTKLLASMSFKRAFTMPVRRG